MKYFLNKIWLVLFSCSALIACSEAGESQILKVGYTQEAPYSRISAQGAAAGVFPDMAKKVADDLGYERIEWVLLSFDNLIPALKDNRIDLIAAGMSISKSRSEMLCFARPLVSSASAFLFNQSNAR